jgi:predicted short-subunit dehydrogenase-like oxidoreductase (DUF2520 family)
MAGSLVIVGAGTVGKAFAKLLTDAGWEFLGAASRAMSSAEECCELVGTGRPTTEPMQLTPRADLVLITTHDDAIRAVCTRLGRAEAFRTGSTVAHCSGALPSTILADARPCGANVGSLHPLQTLPTVEAAVELIPGSYCCIEGDPLAVGRLEEVADDLEMKPIEILPEAKTLYHAAAVVACNYLVALQEAALKLAEAAEIDRGEALRALLPLVRGTVENLEQLGMPDSLTGPVARGDVDTVRRHVEAIHDATPDLLELYQALGREAVEVALARGSIDGDTALELRRLLGEREKP